MSSTTLTVVDEGDRHGVDAHVDVVVAVVAVVVVVLVVSLVVVKMMLVVLLTASQAGGHQDIIDETLTRHLVDGIGLDSCNSATGPADPSILWY